MIRGRRCWSFENNYFTEMCSGSEAGSYVRFIDFVYHSTLGLRVIKKKTKRPFREEALRRSESREGLDPSNSRPIFLSISIYIYTYIYVSISISIYLSLYLYLSIYPSIYVSISIHLYLYIYISISVSIYLSRPILPTAPILREEALHRSESREGLTPPTPARSIYISSYIYIYI